MKKKEEMGRIKKKTRTVERTPRAASIVPAIGATATHLTIDNDTNSPGSVSLVAILARASRLLTGNVCEKSLDVAAPDKVKLLLLASLNGKTTTGLAHEAPRQGAGRLIQVEIIVAALASKLGSRLHGTGRASHDGSAGGGCGRRVLHLRVHVLLGEGGELGGGAEGLQGRVDAWVGGGGHVGHETELLSLVLDALEGLRVVEVRVATVVFRRGGARVGVQLLVIGLQV